MHFEGNNRLKRYDGVRVAGLAEPEVDEEERGPFSLLEIFLDDCSFSARSRHVVGMLFSGAPIIILSALSTFGHQRSEIGVARTGQELQPLYLCNPLQPTDGKHLL